MTSFLPLSIKADANGNVDFLANQTKREYINLRGVNDENTINTVKKFLFTFKVWFSTDKITLVKRPIKYVPLYYHNISFIINFYETGLNTYEKKVEPQVIEEVIIKKEEHKPVEKIKKTVKLLDTSTESEDFLGSSEDSDIELNSDEDDIRSVELIRKIK